MSAIKQTTLVALFVTVLVLFQQSAGDVVLAGGRLVYQPDSPDSDFLFLNQQPAPLVYNQIASPILGYPTRPAAILGMSPRIIRRGRIQSTLFVPPMF